MFLAVRFLNRRILSFILRKSISSSVFEGKEFGFPPFIEIVAPTHFVIAWMVVEACFSL